MGKKKRSPQKSHKSIAKARPNHGKNRSKAKESSSELSVFVAEMESDTEVAATNTANTAARKVFDDLSLKDKSTNKKSQSSEISDDDSSHPPAYSSANALGVDRVSAHIRNAADKVFDKTPQKVIPTIGSAAISEASIDASATLGSKDTASSSSPEATNLPRVDNPKPWVKLFENNRRSSQGMALKFHTHTDPVCKIRLEDCKPTEDAWGPTLIGYVAGRFPGKSNIAECCKAWGVPYKFSIHRSGWLIFKFNSFNDMNDVLVKGPYFIFHRPLLLKEVPPFFRFQNEEICNVPIWVQLPELPKNLWTDECLGMILSRVGKPVRTDDLTYTCERYNYARALVEVNASKELIKQVDIELPCGKSFTQEVEYEYVPHFCSLCKAIGHVESNCRYSPSYSAAPAPATHSTAHGAKTYAVATKNSATPVAKPTAPKPAVLKPATPKHAVPKSIVPKPVVPKPAAPARAAKTTSIPLTIAATPSGKQANRQKGSASITTAPDPKGKGIAMDDDSVLMAVDRSGVDSSIKIGGHHPPIFS